jgi:hypothetical protein
MSRTCRSTAVKNPHRFIYTLLPRKRRRVQGKQKKMHVCPKSVPIAHDDDATVVLVSY